ncbi:MAG TPA: PLP-dependent aminotransferase family protein [Candidatus Obscuribacterales bacterium]
MPDPSATSHEGMEKSEALPQAESSAVTAVGFAPPGHGDAIAVAGAALCPVYENAAGPIVVPDMDEIFAHLLAHLNPKDKQPMYRQMAQAVRVLIARGKLLPKDRFPSVRLMSKRLAISKATVQKCMDQLIAEGTLCSLRGVGTFVSDKCADLSAIGVAEQQEAPEAVRSFRQLLTECEAQLWKLMPPELRSEAMRENTQRIGNHAGRLGMNVEIPSREKRRRPELLSNWSISIINDRQDSYDKQGLPALREHLAHWLNVSKGVKCTADDIMITNGTREALNIIACSLLKGSQSFLIEEPGSMLARTILARSGATAIPVLLDNAGIIIDELESRSAQLLYCNPSCQFPTGAILPASRRTQIAGWARSKNSVVIEEDNVGEFTYDSRRSLPIFSLAPEKVVLLCGFNVTLGAAWRLGLMVAKGALKDLLLSTQVALATPANHLVQRMLLQFIEEGLLERRVQDLSKQFDEKRSVLLEQLSQSRRSQFIYTPARAGCYQAVWLPSTVDDVALIAASRLPGAVALPISPYFIQPPRRPGVIFNFALASKEQIVNAVSTFDEVLRELYG